MTNGVSTLAIRLAIQLDSAPMSFSTSSPLTSSNCPPFGIISRSSGVQRVGRSAIAMIYSSLGSSYCRPGQWRSIGSVYPATGRAHRVVTAIGTNNVLTGRKCLLGTETPPYEILCQAAFSGADLVG